eukprot:14819805-Alexandrium_andersonii.AAC.1
MESLSLLICLRGDGARRRGPVARGSLGRAQLIPAEPVQPRCARRSPAHPAQGGKQHVAIDHIAADGLGEDVRG